MCKAEAEDSGPKSRAVAITHGQGTDGGYGGAKTCDNPVSYRSSSQAHTSASRLANSA